MSLWRINTIMTLWRGGAAPARYTRVQNNVADVKHVDRHTSHQVHQDYFTTQSHVPSESWGSDRRSHTLAYRVHQKTAIWQNQQENSSADEIGKRCHQNHATVVKPYHPNTQMTRNVRHLIGESRLFLRNGAAPWYFWLSRLINTLNLLTYQFISITIYSVVGIFY